MNLELTHPTLEQAELNFQDAMEEYSRPAEDVVPFMVCDSAYKAVINYFKAFIEMKEGALHYSDSPRILLSECRILDPRFNELNIDLFDFRDKNDDVFMDMTIVRRYINIMSFTRRLVVGVH